MVHRNKNVETVYQQKAEERETDQIVQKHKHPHHEVELMIHINYKKQVSFNWAAWMAKYAV